VESTADRLLDLQARYRNALLAARATANTLALLDELFINPIIDAGRVQRVLSVSAPTARAALRMLEEHGILREVSGRQWRRTYRADEIYAVVSASPTEN
jgi:Fic family protein